MNRLLAKSLFSLALTPLLATASTVTLQGPVSPSTGQVCTPGVTPDCVIGNPLDFNIFSVSLTSPATAADKWHLEILTNYGTTLPGGSAVVPTYAYENKQFGMADFMIQWGSEFYGVVLTAHDGYAAGNLYKASGFQTSGQVMGAQGVINIPRPNLPALLKAGGTLAGAGTIAASAIPGSNGVTQALYKVSVDFAAPINFLGSGTVTIYAASYVCDNGFITGTSSPFPTGHDIPPVPEPPTWTLAIPAVAAWAMRAYKNQVNKNNTSLA